MQVQAIKSFLMVYETQNITKASERLFVTQQCLSRQIKSIEDELGILLFVRKKTGMTPTEICHRIFPELQRMIACFENTRTICVESRSGDSPKLTIVMVNGMSNYLDFSILSAAASVTGQELLIRELPGSECFKQLLSGEVDLAFLLEPFDDTMLEHELVFRDYGYLAMYKGHPLATTPAPIPLSALDGQKIITGVSTGCATEHFWRYCSQTNIFPRCVASVSNLTGYVNSLCQPDVAVTLLSGSIPNITNPDVVFRKVVSPELVGNCHCCFLKNSPKAVLLRNLISTIKEHFDRTAYMRK